VSISGSGYSEQVPGLTITKDLINDAMQLRLIDPTNNRKMDIGQGTNLAYISFNSHANQNLTFVSDAEDNHIFLDGGTGKVGIGTSILSSKLTIDGDISSSGITASGGIIATGDIITEGHITSSGDIIVGGHITASGGISASEFTVNTCKFTEKIEIKGGGETSFGNLMIMGGDESFITPHTQSLIQSDGNLSITIGSMGNPDSRGKFFEIRDAAGGAGFPLTNTDLLFSVGVGGITASGNISSSGNIIGTVDGGTF
jgi:hypothetical protein